MAESYLSLLREYNINVIEKIQNIEIMQDLMTDRFYFTFWYKTKEDKLVRIMYILSDYWLQFNEGNLNIGVNKEIEGLIKFRSNGSTGHPASQKKCKQYATLFHQKIEDYFKKTNWVMLGDNIITKVIRMTAENLNPQEQILLTKSALESCELDDLLK